MAKAKKGTTASTKSSTKSSKPTVVVTRDEPWYNYPEYYDAGFAENVTLEADFFEKCFEKFVPHKVERLFEPGCGSGRLIVEMAKRGYDVTGLDLSKPMLNFCRKELKRFKTKASLVQGDMIDFKLDQKVDAAFNPVNTFRHLLTEDDARRHLECVANALNDGGIYILGLHLIPKDGELFGTERWQAKHQDARIYYSLTVEDCDLKKRVERLRLTMTVKRPEESFKLIDHLHLRLYNARQIKSLVASVPQFKIRSVFDFWYEIDEPQKLDSEICDTILVLQKTAG